MIDPTGTGHLQRAFGRAVRKKLEVLGRAVIEKLVRQDVLGLQSFQSIMFNVQDWKYHSDPEKLEVFRLWLQAQIDAGLLFADASGEPWTFQYIDSAYKRGIVRAFTDTQKKKMGAEELKSSRNFFAESASQPERLAKIRMLALRSLELLRGMTASMGSQMNVILADGLARGLHPRAIARDMVQKVGLTYTRALTIARTEIIHAHAEGQLDAFDEMNVIGVGIMAEWSTAGDNLVCPLCNAREGQVLSIEDARGLIPLHPNCRCAWIPAAEVADRQRLKKKVKASREN